MAMHLFKIGLGLVLMTSVALGKNPDGDRDSNDLYTRIVFADGEIVQAGTPSKAFGLVVASFNALLNMNPRVGMLLLSGFNAGSVCFIATGPELPELPSTENKALARGVDSGASFALWKYLAELDQMGQLSRIQAIKTLGRNIFKGLAVQLPVSTAAFLICQRLFGQETAGGGQ